MFTIPVLILSHACIAAALNASLVDTIFPEQNEYLDGFGFDFKLSSTHAIVRAKTPYYMIYEFENLALRYKQRIDPPRSINVGPYGNIYKYVTRLSKYYQMDENTISMYYEKHILIYVLDDATKTFPEEPTKVIEVDGAHFTHFCGNDEMVAVFYLNEVQIYRKENNWEISETISEDNIGYGASELWCNDNNEIVVSIGTYVGYFVNVLHYENGVWNVTHDLTGKKGPGVSVSDNKLLQCTETLSNECTIISRSSDGTFDSLLNTTITIPGGRAKLVDDNTIVIRILPRYDQKDVHSISVFNLDSENKLGDKINTINFDPNKFQGRGLQAFDGIVLFGLRSFDQAKQQFKFESFFLSKQDNYGIQHQISEPTKLASERKQFGSAIVLNDDKLMVGNGLVQQEDIHEYLLSDKAANKIDDIKLEKYIEGTSTYTLTVENVLDLSISKSNDKIGIISSFPSQKYVSVFSKQNQADSLWKHESTFKSYASEVQFFGEDLYRSSGGDYISHYKWTNGEYVLASSINMDLDATTIIGEKYIFTLNYDDVVKEITLRTFERLGSSSDEPLQELKLPYTAIDKEIWFRRSHEHDTLVFQTENTVHVVREHDDGWKLENSIALPELNLVGLATAENMFAIATLVEDNLMVYVYEYCDGAFVQDPTFNLSIEEVGKFYSMEVSSKFLVIAADKPYDVGGIDSGGVYVYSLTKHCTNVTPIPKPPTTSPTPEPTGPTASPTEEPTDEPATSNNIVGVIVGSSVGAVVVVAAVVFIHRQIAWKKARAEPLDLESVKV